MLVKRLSPILSYCTYNIKYSIPNRLVHCSAFRTKKKKHVTKSEGKY